MPRHLLGFFLLAFGIAWAITIPIALRAQGILSRDLVPAPVQWLIGFAPAVAALLVARGTKAWAGFAAAARRVSVDGRWYLVALVAPWALLGVAVLVRSGAGLRPVTLHGGTSTLVLSLAWLVLAWGEEVGWRGFALPILDEAYGFGRAALVLGLVWCVWHYPKLLSSPYLHADATGIAMLAQFSLQILVANVMLCWLFLHTRSAPVAAVFHASWNTVATVYPMAAVDPVLTGCLVGLTALGIRVAPLAPARSRRFREESTDLGEPIRDVRLEPGPGRAPPLD